MSRRVQLRGTASESRIHVERLAFVPEILNGGRRVCPRTAPPGGGGGGISLGRYLRGRKFYTE